MEGGGENGTGWKAISVLLPVLLLPLLQRGRRAETCLFWVNMQGGDTVFKNRSWKRYGKRICILGL